MTSPRTAQRLARILAMLPWVLANQLGGAKATQILLDVPTLTAEDALTLGLVNYVTAPDRLEEHRRRLDLDLGKLIEYQLIVGMVADDDRGARIVESVQASDGLL